MEWKRAAISSFTDCRLAFVLGKVTRNINNKLPHFCESIPPPPPPLWANVLFCCEDVLHPSPCRVIDVAAYCVHGVSATECHWGREGWSAPDVSLPCLSPVHILFERKSTSERTGWQSAEEARLDDPNVTSCCSVWVIRHTAKHLMSHFKSQLKRIILYCRKAQPFVFLLFTLDTGFLVLHLFHIIGLSAFSTVFNLSINLRCFQSHPVDL